MALAYCLPMQSFNSTEVTIGKPVPDCLEPLLEFVSAMSSDEVLPSKQCASDFANLCKIMKAESVSPMDVKRALAYVEEHTSGERLVLATFTALPTGKKFIELATEFSEEKLKTFQCMLDLDNVKMECSAHIERMQADDGVVPDISKLFDEVLRLTTKFAQASEAAASCTEESRNASIKDARGGLVQMLDVLMSGHFGHEFLPWVQSQLRLMKSSDWTLPEPPNFSVFRMRNWSLSEPTTSDELTLTPMDAIGLYDNTAVFAKRMVDMSALKWDGSAAALIRAKSTELCATYTEWRALMKKVIATLADHYQVVCKDFMDNLGSVVDETFSKAWALVPESTCEGFFLKHCCLFHLP